MEQFPDKVTVLVSGGLDSSVLMTHLARSGTRVYPVYVRHGLYWEPEELDNLNRFIATADCPGIEPLSVLSLPATDLYEDHWSVTGVDVPGSETPDEAVYLPGRNVLLLSKVAVWCERRGINTLALATLSGNPFADNSPEFYKLICQTLSLALNFEIQIITPFRQLKKQEVIELGKDSPLFLTFSCCRPVKGVPCGACNKCAERRHAFKESSVPDQTVYAC